jgi:aspartyl-tRNA(Asn)/glutamyl-tRNA(Gln) amidotransferase subunit C
MAVSIQEVEHVAMLARLSFSDEEKKALTRQLNDVLTYMEQLNTLDTSDVEPLSHVIELSPDAGGMFREDELKPCVSREDALKNAPTKLKEFFKVPKVIGER